MRANIAECVGARNKMVAHSSRTIGLMVLLQNFSETPRHRFSREF
jgi:hypothetical protein